MKVAFFTIVLLLLVGSAQAGDVSCQGNLLKPKIKAAVIEEEADKPASITVAEARLRLQKSRAVDQPEDDQDTQEPVQADETEVAAKSAKKESRLGGIFDILLPSKLRNPVK